MRSLRLSEIFPKYPFILRTPDKSPVKFGTRNMYVDFPYQAYWFMGIMMEKAQKEAITSDFVRRAWLEYINEPENRHYLTFEGKPLGAVCLNPYVGKPHLRLVVNWALFIKYLDKRAQDLFNEVKADGRKIMKLYRVILHNLFAILGKMVAPSPMYSPEARTSLENFRKLLRRTGDLPFMRSLIEDLVNANGTGLLQRVWNTIRKRYRDDARLIYLTDLMADLIHLYYLINNVNIPTAYLLLRNMIEVVMKACIYFKEGRAIGDYNLVMYVMYLYDYEEVRRVYSLSNFRRMFRKRWIKLLSDLGEGEVTLVEIVENLKQKQMGKIGLCDAVIKDFLEEVGLEYIKIDEIYRACSEVVHNRPPLPFFSLLEIKFFKYFLEHCLNALKTLIINLLLTEDESTSLEKESRSTITLFSLVDMKGEERYIALARKLSDRPGVKEAIKSALRNEDAYVLASLIHIVDPSWKKVREWRFTEEDLRDLLGLMKQYSFRIFLDFDRAFRPFYEKVCSVIDDPKFTALADNEKEKVVFYILLDKVPLIMREIRESL